MARYFDERKCAAAEAQVRGVLDLLTGMRSSIAALGLPPSESADELRQGLDIAWVGARRLVEEWLAPLQVGGEVERQETEAAGAPAGLA